MVQQRARGSAPRSQLRISRGRLKGRIIQFAAQADLRPTLGKVRAAVFNILGPDLDHGFIDVFAGSGIMGFEACSQGFSPVILCETHPQTCSDLRHNVAQLEAPITVFSRAAATMPTDQLEPKPYVIYADPPFQSPQLHAEVSRVMGECPNVLEQSSYVAESESASPPELHPAWRLEDTRRYGRIYLYWFVKVG